MLHKWHVHVNWLGITIAVSPLMLRPDFQILAFVMGKGAFVFGLRMVEHIMWLIYLLTYIIQFLSATIHYVSIKYTNITFF